MVLVVRNLPANTGDARDACSIWVGQIPWNRKWQPTPEFFPGKFHGQRKLAGYRPWGHKELDMTEHHGFMILFSKKYIKNTIRKAFLILQYSTLESTVKQNNSWYFSVAPATSSCSHACSQTSWAWNKDAAPLSSPQYRSVRSTECNHL